MASHSPDKGTTDPIQSAVSVTALTNVGMRRRNNQDSLAVHLAEGRVSWERSGHLFIVADGMGAHAAGELASRLAVDLVQHHYEKQDQASPADNLHRAVVEANSEIYRRGQANIEFRNMGTTCSVLALLPEGALCAHVGDSRIYRLRGTQLEQLTFDHSLIWEMHAASGMNEEAMRSSSIPKNVITRSLGPNQTVQVDLEGPMPIEKGDIFMLCSDGLSGQLSDVEMGVLLRALPNDVAGQAMLDLANLRGGPDNITLIIVRVLGDEMVTKQDVTLGAARHPVHVPTFPWPFAVASAICALGATILWMAHQVPLAVVIGILSLIILLIGLMRYRSLKPVALRDTQHFGRSPYRRYQCQPDAAMLERLAGTIQDLGEVAQENKWNDAIEAIEKLRLSLQHPAANRDPMETLRLYAEGIVDAMRSIRNFRSTISDPTHIRGD